MTQQEFEKRTGINYAHGEFDDMVNPTDFDTIDLSIRLKDAPNEIRLALNPSDIHHWIYKRFFRKPGVPYDYTGVIDDFAYTLIEIAAGTKDLETSAKAREKAIKLIGIKEYIRRRIELCCELDKKDLIALRDEILK